MVQKLIVHPDILSNYSTISCDLPHIKKEVKMNLLEHMLTLYLRVRTFSYAKDKVEQFKLLKKRSKSRALRTEIKKSSAVNL